MRCCVYSNQRVFTKHITHSRFRTLYAFVWSSFPVQTTPLAIANAGSVEEDREVQGIHIHQGRMISVVGWLPYPQKIKF